MPLRNRVALLTGAAGGIGRVMTRALLDDGQSVAAVDRDVDSLERLKTSVNAAERLCPILADLNTEAECTQAIKIALQRFGTIEVLINNAGIGMSSIRPDAEARYPGIEELTPEIWDRFFSIFVRAPVILTRAALPLMRKSVFGRIINNTTSYRTMLRVLPYGSAKAALESMTAVWAKEVEGSAITVNVLVPGGPTDTPMIDQAGWPREKYGAASPLARFGRLGQLQWAADHGRPLGFLASACGGCQTRQSPHRVAGAFGRRDMADGQDALSWVGSRS